MKLPYVILAAILILNAAVVSGAAPRPNILWLVAEDTGPSAYSCYGLQPAAATPTIDALAASGVRYDRFYTTAPVCSPSRSAWNTGMYQTTIGAHQHRTPSARRMAPGRRLLHRQRAGVPRRPEAARRRQDGLELCRG